MLLVSNATFRGVAPLAPGWSTGSVFLPLYWGDPSRRREMVVPINSTWLISSVPTPCKRSLYGFDVASPRKLMLWNRYCIIVRISPNWPPRPSCSALAAAGSGSSTTISLISCWVCKYIILLKWIGVPARRQSAHWSLFRLLADRAVWCVALCPAIGANGSPGVIARAPQRGTEGDHGDRKPQVQPVVGVVDGNEVGRTVVVYDKAVDEEQQVHDAPTDEVRAGTVERASEGDSGEAERQMHQVMQHRDVEDAQKRGIRVMPSECELVIVRRDARYEAQH